MAETTCEKFLAALKEINKGMKEDIKAGHKWVYTNRKHRESTF